MSLFQYSCPQCGKQIESDEQNAGLRAQCRHCRTWHVVPYPEAAAAPGPQSAEEGEELRLRLNVKASAVPAQHTGIVLKEGRAKRLQDEEKPAARRKPSASFVALAPPLPDAQAPKSPEPQSFFDNLGKEYSPAKERMKSFGKSLRHLCLIVLAVAILGGIAYGLMQAVALVPNLPSRKEIASGWSIYRANMRLLMALRANDVARAQQAFEAGATPVGNLRKGKSALELAKSDEMTALVKEWTQSLQNALQTVADDATFSRLVNERGLCPTHTWPDDSTWLFHTTNPFAIRRLVSDYQLNPNQRGYQKNLSPLHMAVIQNLPETVTALIKAGADPDILGGEPDNLAPPIFLAETMETVRTLVEGGANVNLVTPEGDTALHHVVKSWDPATGEQNLWNRIRILYLHGADIKALDSQQRDFQQLLPERNRVQP